MPELWIAQKFVYLKEVGVKRVDIWRLFLSWMGIQE